MIEKCDLSLPLQTEVESRYARQNIEILLQENIYSPNIGTFYLAIRLVYRKADLFTADRIG